MNNNYTKVLICCLAMQSLCASEGLLDEQLSQSETSCNPEMYAKLISSKNIEQWRKNYSLTTILGNCTTSGNLSKMVKANIASGGQATDTKMFHACSDDGPGFWGYDKTALGFLISHNVNAQDETVTKDIEEATKILVKEGCSVDTALLDACARQNVPVYRALVKLGAKPGKGITVGSNPVYSNSFGGTINAYDVARHSLSTYEGFKKECISEGKSNCQRYDSDIVRVRSFIDQVMSKKS